MDVCNSKQEEKVELEIKTIHVAGVQYRPPSVIDALESGQEIRFVAEPGNEYDRFAIKIEALIPEPAEPDSQTGISLWYHIGYVPKRETWVFHLLRKLGVKLTLKLFVNHDAPDQDKLIVRVTALGNEEASF